MTATIENGDRPKAPFDLKVMLGEKIYLRLDIRSKHEYAIFCKCKRCGYVFRSSDYWRRRGGWRRGKVEKLMRKCIKCGHGKFYFHNSPWIICYEKLNDNPLDSSIQIMEISGGSDMRKVKEPWKLASGTSTP